MTLETHVALLRRNKRLVSQVLAFLNVYPSFSVTSKKSQDVYKSCPKMIQLEKLKILTPLQKLPMNVVDLGKLVVATGFEKLPNVQ